MASRPSCQRCEDRWIEDTGPATWYESATGPPAIRAAAVSAASFAASTGPFPFASPASKPAAAASPAPVVDLTSLTADGTQSSRSAQPAAWLRRDQPAVRSRASVPVRRYSPAAPAVTMTTAAPHVSSRLAQPIGSRPDRSGKRATRSSTLGVMTSTSRSTLESTRCQSTAVASDAGSTAARSIEIVTSESLARRRSRLRAAPSSLYSAGRWVGYPRWNVAPRSNVTAEPSNLAFAPMWCQNARSWPTVSQTTEYDVPKPGHRRIPLASVSYTHLRAHETRHDLV